MKTYLNPSSEDNFCLVTTDHLNDKIWFRDDDDFKVGMNHVAIVSHVSIVRILAFILMSNHVHFVLQCSENDARSFITEFKRRYGLYHNKRYGVKDYLRHNKVDTRKLIIGDESLQRGIAYTLMNSVAANICLDAADYPWGSAGIYFKVTESKGRKLDVLSDRARFRILHSREAISGEMLLGENNYILPESYVPVKFVEALFRTPKCMRFFLMNSSKAKHRLSFRDAIPSFRDQTIVSAIPDICRNILKKNSQEELNTKELAGLISEIRWRFNADPKQIARILGIQYSEVTNLIESF